MGSGPFGNYLPWCRAMISGQLREKQFQSWSLCMSLHASYSRYLALRI
jgi:hypothetical protein